MAILAKRADFGKSRFRGQNAKKLNVGNLISTFFTFGLFGQKRPFWPFWSKVPKRDFAVQKRAKTLQKMTPIWVVSGGVPPKRCHFGSLLGPFLGYIWSMPIVRTPYTITMYGLVPSFGDLGGEVGAKLCPSSRQILGQVYFRYFCLLSVLAIWDISAF